MFIRCHVCPSYKECGSELKNRVESFRCHEMGYLYQDGKCYVTKSRCTGKADCENCKSSRNFDLMRVTAERQAMVDTIKGRANNAFFIAAEANMPLAVYVCDSTDNSTTTILSAMADTVDHVVGDHVYSALGALNEAKTRYPMWFHHSETRVINDLYVGLYFYL